MAGARAAAADASAKTARCLIGAAAAEMTMDPRITTALLYLDGVTVSFDGFRALNNLSFTSSPARCAPSSVPWRRQDHHDGRRHRQDPARCRGRLFRRLLRSFALGRDRIALLGIGRKFRADRLDMHTSRTYRLAPRGTGAAKALVWRQTSEEASRINSILEIIRLAPVRHRVAGSLSHGRNSGSRSACCAQEPKLLLVDEPVAA